MGCCGDTIEGLSADNEKFQFIKKKLNDEYNIYLNFIQSIKKEINQNETISKYFYTVPLNWFENWEKTIQIALGENRIIKSKFDFKYKNITIPQKCNFEIISEELWNKLLRDNIFPIEKEKRNTKKGNLCNGKIIFSDDKFIEIFFYENEDDLFFKNLIFDCSSNERETYKIYHMLKTSPIQEILGNINYNELDSNFKFKGYNSLIINKSNKISTKIKKFREYQYQLIIRIIKEDIENDKKENGDKNNNSSKNIINNFNIGENRNIYVTNLNSKQNNDNENSEHKITSRSNIINNITYSGINNDKNEISINIHNISNQQNNNNNPISENIINLKIQNNNNRNLKNNNFCKISSNSTSADTKKCALFNDKLQISENLDNNKNNLEKKRNSSVEEVINHEKSIFIRMHNRLNIKSNISDFQTFIDNNNISNINISNINISNINDFNKSKNIYDKNYIFAFMTCLCNINELNYYINNELNDKILSNKFIQIIKNNNKNYNFDNIKFFSIKDFLETLHFELNKELNESNKIENNQTENKLSVDNKNNEYLNEIIKKFKEKNNSIISELFYGLIEGKYVCTKCFNSEFLYETNIYISLDINEINNYFNNKTNISINDCISFYIDNYIFDNTFNCLKCQNAKINKINKFIIFPQILIIYFNHEGTEIENKKIEIEEVIEFEQKKYKLISFILINNDKKIENNYEYNSYYKDSNNWYEYKENNKILLQNKISEITNGSNFSTIFYQIIK